MEVRGTAVRSFGAGSAVLAVGSLDERPSVLGRLGAVRLRVIDVDADICLARRTLREPASGSGVGVSDVGVCRLAVGAFGSGNALIALRPLKSLQASFALSALGALGPGVSFVAFWAGGTGSAFGTGISFIALGSFGFHIRITIAFFFSL
ncbi:hypothetical protein IX324_001678 [Bacteroides pyogenes]|nr:hypothetical protein [Bacteroides pyogenes]